MDGLAFPSGQCRGRSWPNAYGLCPRSLIARSINQSINHSLSAFTVQSVRHTSDQHRVGSSVLEHVALMESVSSLVRLD